MEALEHESGTIESCVKLMQNDNLLIIYPGGVREAINSDNNYKVCWRDKAGFATVAQQAKCVN